MLCKIYCAPTGNQQTSCIAPRGLVFAKRLFLTDKNDLGSVSDKLNYSGIFTCDNKYRCSCLALPFPSLRERGEGEELIFSHWNIWILPAWEMNIALKPTYLYSYPTIRAVLASNMTCSPDDPPSQTYSPLRLSGGFIALSNQRRLANSWPPTQGHA